MMMIRWFAMGKSIHLVHFRSKQNCLVIWHPIWFRSCFVRKELCHVILHILQLYRMLLLVSRIVFTLIKFRPKGIPHMLWHWQVQQSWKTKNGFSQNLQQILCWPFYALTMLLCTVLEYYFVRNSSKYVKSIFLHIFSFYNRLKQGVNSDSKHML